MVGFQPCADRSEVRSVRDRKDSRFSNALTMTLQWSIFKLSDGLTSLISRLFPTCEPNPPLSINTTMNLIRPPTVDAALQACTRRPLSAVYRSALQRKTIPSSTIRRRWISDGSRPPMPPGATQKTTVVAPKTRMAVGVVFIGALIYSMVSLINHRALDNY